MKFKNVILINLFLIFVLSFGKSLADNHNVFEILEKIQKDLKTLERAVYSGSVNTTTNNIDNTSSITGYSNINKSNIYRSIFFSKFFVNISNSCITGK